MGGAAGTLGPAPAAAAEGPAAAGSAVEREGLEAGGVGPQSTCCLKE